MKSIFAMSLVAVAVNAFAAEPPDKEGPCKAIKEACEKAGFIKGDAKQGFGLWVDCIDPIMKGTPQPAGAKKPLPAVGADMVNACKAKHPNFGEGRAKEIKKQ
jgi:hypothetical protein